MKNRHINYIGALVCVIAGMFSDFNTIKTLAFIVAIIILGIGR